LEAFEFTARILSRKNK